MAFAVDEVGVFVGWSIQGLSEEALEHETEPKFKDAAVKAVKSKIKEYSAVEWTNYPDPEEFYYWEESGSSEKEWVKNYLLQVLQHAEAVGSMTIGPMIGTGCDNSPKGWERSRAFTVSLGGNKMTLAAAAQRYAEEEGVKMSERAKNELGALDILFTVRWTATEL